MELLKILGVVVVVLPAVLAGSDNTPCKSILSGTLPHPTDCSQFYSCVNEESETLSCPSGLAYNPLKETCGPQTELPLWARCLLANDQVEAVTEPYEPRCNASSVAYKVPHPYDCQKYFICYLGVSYPESCSSGQLFNPEKNDCDLAANLPPDAPCRTGGTSLPPESTTSSAGASETTSQFSDSTVSASSTEAPYMPICTGQPDGVYLPHPTDCSAYFICVDESPIAGTCPGGLFFDPATRTCVATDPGNLPCNEPSPEEKCANATNGEYIPDPLSCQSYFICLDGDAVPLSCSPLFFDPVGHSCVIQSDLPPNVPCSISTAPPPSSSLPTTIITTIGPISSEASTEDFTSTPPPPPKVQQG